MCGIINQFHLVLQVELPNVGECLVWQTIIESQCLCGVRVAIAEVC